jgi:hypothetical protein
VRPERGITQDATVGFNVWYLVVEKILYLRMQILSIYKYDIYQQSINICHVNIHLVSAITSSCMIKKFKIIYLTDMIFILNFIFTVVFYLT